MLVGIGDVREVSRRLLDLGLLLGEESRKGDDVGVDLLLRDWASFVTVGRHGVSIWVSFSIQGVVVQRQRSYNGKLVSAGKGKMGKSMGNGEVWREGWWKSYQARGEQKAELGIVMKSGWVESGRRTTLLWHVFGRRLSYSPRQLGRTRLAGSSRCFSRAVCAAAVTPDQGRVVEGNFPSFMAQHGLAHW
jgi:hypothetical protein